MRFRYSGSSCNDSKFDAVLCFITNPRFCCHYSDPTLRRCRLPFASCTCACTSNTSEIDSEDFKRWVHTEYSVLGMPLPVVETGSFWSLIDM